MHPITHDQIRAGFVNCTKGEAKRMALPSLDSVDWENLDYFGWRDPGSPAVGGLALWRGDETVSIALRATARTASMKQGMCSLCHTFHPSADVAMMGARRAGSRGREGNSVGAAMCADLACSLYARKIKQPRRVQPQETLDLTARVERLQANLDRFVSRVVDGL
ncbi:FBP domain-containing protein [Luteococcus sp. Sow4_B9]|uniref:FBP domain-containing protein n=1 Tax=Luteococcus sp. Sow4_B9 TaxID=3438792 RepID=UPI003F9E3898